MSNTFYCRGDWLRIVEERHEEDLVSMARIEIETRNWSSTLKRDTFEKASRKLHREGKIEAQKQRRDGFSTIPSVLLANLLN